MGREGRGGKGGGKRGGEEEGREGRGTDGKGGHPQYFIAPPQFQFSRNMSDSWARVTLATLARGGGRLSLFILETVRDRHTSLTGMHERCHFSAALYRVRQNKVAPNIFGSFLSNRLEFKCKILHTCLFISYAHNSLVDM